MRQLTVTRLLAILGLLGVSDAALSCGTYSASDISNAIQNSPSANQTLKGASCDFGGAGVAESGGNTCSSNGNNFGVLQLTSCNLPAGMSSSQYLALPLQQQVDIWAQQVGNSNTSGGYQTLANANSSGSAIGGTSVTPGMLGACFQFGPGICKNDISFMEQNGGQCPTAGNGGVTATRSTLSNGTANLDGNNQSICSWGQAIQNKINQAAATCSQFNNCPMGPGDFPNTPIAAQAPTPAATDVNVATNQV